MHDALTGVLQTAAELALAANSLVRSRARPPWAANVKTALFTATAFIHRGAIPHTVKLRAFTLLNAIHSKPKPICKRAVRALIMDVTTARLLLPNSVCHDQPLCCLRVGDGG